VTNDADQPNGFTARTQRVRHKARNAMDLLALRCWEPGDGLAVPWVMTDHLKADVLIGSLEGFLEVKFLFELELTGNFVVS
jgi:hypothetical protein